jgi:hypothetical protein
MSASAAVFLKECLSRKRVYLSVFSAVAAVMTLGLAGCGDRAEDSRHQMNKFQIAMIEYAVKHGGEWPDRLDQIKDDVGGEAAFSKMMKNPLTNDDPGYEYVKPKGKQGSPGFDAQQVVLYQLRGGKRDTSLKVGYAEGSVRPLAAK